MNETKKILTQLNYKTKPKYNKTNEWKSEAQILL